MKGFGSWDWFGDCVNYRLLSCGFWLVQEWSDAVNEHLVVKSDDVDWLPVPHMHFKDDLVVLFGGSGVDVLVFVLNLVELDGNPPFLATAKDGANHHLV